MRNNFNNPNNNFNNRLNDYYIPNSRYSNNDAFCEYCKRYGHTIDRCLTLNKLKNLANEQERNCGYCNASDHSVQKCASLKIAEQKLNFCEICLQDSRLL